MEVTQATASFVSAANRFCAVPQSPKPSWHGSTRQPRAAPAQEPHQGWAAFGMGTEARTGVIFRFCPEPRREIARAEISLHLALARRGQEMPGDCARLAAAATLVEAAHARRPEPMTAVLADLLRRTDDPGECLIILAVRAAGGEISPARRANGRD